MQKITQRDKKILVVLCAVIVAAIYLQFILLPSLNSISQSKQAIDSLASRVDEMYSLRIQNVNMKKNLKKLSKEYDDSKSKLPVNERNPEIEYDIQNIASDSKVTVSSIVFGDAKPFTEVSNNKNQQASSNNSSEKNGDLIEIPVNINVTGNDKDSIMKFLSSIESTNRISEINDANITLNNATTQDSNNSQDKKLTLSVTANYFYIVSKDKESIQYNFGTGK